MKISAIVAMSKNRVIGRNNQLPWHLPEDLKRFKRITMGHPMIMGRKTFESIGRVLPGRESIIITRQKDYQVPGAVVVPSLKDAIEYCRNKSQTDEAFVIGGGEVFRDAMPLLNRIHLTLIDAEIEGDVFFPEISKELFREVSREDHLGQPTPYRFLILEKID
nr:Dihydrofolate reductase [uncultured bacterium]